MDKQSDGLEDLVDRKAACEILDISKSGLRYLEGVHLDPIMKNKKVYYRRKQIEEALLERNGEFAAVAFKAFREGKSQIDVIIENSIAPKLVKNLYKTYLRILIEEKDVLFFPFPKDKRLKVESLGYADLTLDVIISALEIAAGMQSFRKEPGGR